MQKSNVIGIDLAKFAGSKEQVRKQIGMAVPSDGASIIFEALLKSFAGEEYDFINPKFSVEQLATLISLADDKELLKKVS